MSKEKRDGNAAARTACEQMVSRLEAQGCEVENWCGGNEGDSDADIEIPYYVNLGQFCEWAMTL